jgi:hypothetical protein
MGRALGSPGTGRGAFACSGAAGFRGGVGARWSLARAATPPRAGAAALPLSLIPVGSASWEIADRGLDAWNRPLPEVLVTHRAGTAATTCTASWVRCTACPRAATRVAADERPDGPVAPRVELAR